MVTHKPAEQLPAVLCQHCTVPTEGADVCTFCQTYTPPAPDSALTRIPVPAGAIAGAWDSLSLDNIPCRSLEWSRHDTAKVGVRVDGVQDATGEVTRFIALDLGTQDLGAADARALAAKLAEAADALEAL